VGKKLACVNKAIRCAALDMSKSAMELPLAVAIISILDARRLVFVVVVSMRSVRQSVGR
jgi:hypothetical protein